MFIKEIPLLNDEQLRIFDSFIKKTDVTTDCWTWIGGVDRQGYGYISIDGESYKEHRVAYVLSYGPIPKNKSCVCHSCDNPGCCNPSHLWIGTVAENNWDKSRKGRGNQPSGNAHWTRTNPEKLHKGDDHHTRKHPEKLRRGNNHWTRRLTELLPRGDSHWSSRCPEKRPHGEKGGASKLKNEQVLEIREKYASGKFTKLELSILFGVSKTNIGHIISRKSWKHI